MLNIIVLLLIVLLFPFALASLSLAPWVPTRKKDLKRIREISDLKPNEIFFELGSGTGILSFYLSKHFPDSKIVGIELAYPLYLFCRIKKIFYKNKNLTFKLRNIYKTNLSNTDAIYYFSKGSNEIIKLKEKFEKELRPGTKIISYAFPIPEWKPIKVSKPTKKDISIYLYIKN